MSQSYAAPTFPQTGLINVRGLAAAEYLLFYAASDNACSAASSINANGTWAALGATELAKRKRDYAAVVAADVAVITRAMADSWSPSGGDFAGELARADQSGAAFESEQLALNAVSDGLFYLEREVKDLSSAAPSACWSAKRRRVLRRWRANTRSSRATT